MGYLEQAIDTWRATATRRVELIRAALLDVYDCGIPELAVTPRTPSVGEKEATYRVGDRGDRGDRFHYAPTPKGQSRRQGVSDPVGQAAQTWEREMQAATRDLYTTISFTVATVGALGLVPLSEDGELLEPPKEPAVQRDETGKVLLDRANRPTVMEHPNGCKAACLDGAVWLQAVVDVLADRWGRQGDDTSREHAYQLDRELKTLSGQVGVFDRRTCEQGCGKVTQVGEGRTCPACRMRASRRGRAA